MHGQNTNSIPDASYLNITAKNAQLVNMKESRYLESSYFAIAFMIFLTSRKSTDIVF